jgi:transposase-like protein
MIILYLGDGIKSYRENYLRYLPEKVVCPVCTGDCHWHGQYQRKVRENYEIHTITIRRVLCVTCRKTHALLPDFLRPRSRYSQKVREEALTKYTKQKVPAEAVTCDGQAIKTTLRWIRRFKEDVQEAIMTLTSLLAGFGRFRLPKKGPVFRQLKQQTGLLMAVLGGPVKHSCEFGLVNILMSLGPPPPVYL